MNMDELSEPSRIFHASVSICLRHRWFPDIGVPLVIIHLIDGISYKPSSSWGTPMTMESPNSVPMCFQDMFCIVLLFPGWWDLNRKLAGSMILSASLSGAIVLRDVYDLPGWRIGLYSLSVMVVILGNSEVWSFENWKNLEEHPS